VGAAGTLLVIALTPAAVAGAVVWLPRVVRAVRARARPGDDLRPVGRPLERTAADLRRLMTEHGQVRRSTTIAVRGMRLRALEGAITDCAFEAADALGVPRPAGTGHQPLPRAELRALLVDLTRSGLVLPDAEGFGR
jgi:hypothetical protein